MTQECVGLWAVLGVEDLLAGLRVGRLRADTPGAEPGENDTPPTVGVGVGGGGEPAQKGEVNNGYLRAHIATLGGTGYWVEVTCGSNIFAASGNARRNVSFLRPNNVRQALKIDDAMDSCFVVADEPEVSATFLL